MYTMYTPPPDYAPLPRRMASALFGLALLCRAAGGQVASSPSDAAGYSLNQNAGDSCSAATTTRTAAECLSHIKPDLPIPKLDTSHTYTLPELIDIAEQASPETRISWAGAKRALEKVGVERAQYMPLLAFAAQGSDLRAIVPFPKPLAPRGYVTVEEPIATGQMELQYTVLDFARGPRLEASKALELARTLQLGRTHQAIAFKTATQFYLLQQTEGQLEAAKAIMQTAETLMQNAHSQFDNGRATLPDVQNADAGAAEAHYDLADAEGQVKKAKLALTETIGVEPTTEIEIVPQSEGHTEKVEASVEDLIKEAWKSRPDLLAKAQELRGAQQTSKIAHSAYLPKVGLNATAGQTAMWPTADYGQLGYANVTTWSAALQLKWEVFNGARRHEVQAAKAEQKAAAEEQRATQDAVTREVWDSYVEYQTALEQQRSSQTFLSAAQISYDSSLDAFKYGVRSLVDVVQAERQLAQARFAVVRARARLAQSEVALAYSTGKILNTATQPQGVNP